MSEMGGKCMDHPYGESRWTPRYLLTIYPDEDGNCGGFYQQVFQQEPVPFSEITQMILQIDRDISTNGKLYAPDRFRTPEGWGSERVPKPAAPKTAFAPRKRERAAGRVPAISWSRFTIAEMPHGRGRSAGGRKIFAGISEVVWN